MRGTIVGPAVYAVRLMQIVVSLLAKSVLFDKTTIETTVLVSLDTFACHALLKSHKIGPS